MTPLRLTLRKSEFDAVKHGKLNEVVKYTSSKRIHYMCFSRMTRECCEKQSACRECFENARQFDLYMCYPFDRANIRMAKTDKYITKELASVTWEERDGKIVFVIKFKENERDDNRK